MSVTVFREQQAEWIKIGLIKYLAGWVCAVDSVCGVLEKLRKVAKNRRKEDNRLEFYL